MNRGLCSLLALVLVGATSADAQLPTSELLNVIPPGGAAGSTVDLSIDGSNLEEPGTLVFSAEGFKVTPVMSAPTPLTGKTWQDPKRFKVEIPVSVKPGTYHVRFSGAFGVSSSLPFVVSNLKEVVEVAGNNEPAKAMPLNAGELVNGKTDEGKPDIYSIEAKAGETIAVECLAGAIGSRLEPRLVLRTPEGRIALETAGGLSRDGYLTHKAGSDGTYLLAVIDFLTKGGNDYYYRLRRTGGMPGEAVFPPAVERGKEAMIRIGEREITVKAPEEGALRNDPAPAPWHVIEEGFEHEGAWIGIANAPVVVENETSDEPQPVAVPCEIAGRFTNRGDRDAYEFDGVKGKSYIIDVLSERTGRDIDAAFSVEKVTKNDKGEVTVANVASADDTANTSGGKALPLTTRDPSLRVNADADARYRVTIWDNFGGFSDDHSYRMRISEPKPDFRLIAKPKYEFPDKKKLVNASPVLRKGSAVSFDVYALRVDGFEGEVALGIEGVPEGVDIVGDKSFPAKDLHSRITLIENGAKAPWNGSVKITGKAKIGEKEVVRIAVPVQLAKSVNDYDREMVEMRTGGNFVVSILDEAYPLEVKAEVQGPLVSSLGATLEIPVKLTRTGQFKGNVKVRPINLPGMAKAPELNLDPKKDGGTLKIVFNTANNNKFAPGHHNFLLQADGTATLEMRKQAKEEAENLKKESEKAAAELAAASKKAAETKKAAEAALANARKDTALTAEEKAKKISEGEKAIADATAAATAAAEKSKNAEAEKKAFADRAKTLADRWKKKDYKLVTWSAPLQLKLESCPVRFSGDIAPQSLAPGSKGALPVKVERLYGFADSVSVTLELPEPSKKALVPEALVIAKETAEGSMPVGIKPEAAPGDYPAKLVAKVKFNGMDLKTEKDVVFKVTPPAPAPAPAEPKPDPAAPAAQ